MSARISSCIGWCVKNGSSQSAAILPELAHEIRANHALLGNGSMFPPEKPEQLVQENDVDLDNGAIGVDRKLAGLDVDVEQSPHAAHEDPFDVAEVLAFASEAPHYVDLLVLKVGRLRC